MHSLVSTEVKVCVGGDAGHGFTINDRLNRLGVSDLGHVRPVLAEVTCDIVVGLNFILVLVNRHIEQILAEEDLSLVQTFSLLAELPHV